MGGRMGCGNGSRGGDANEYLLRAAKIGQLPKLGEEILAHEAQPRGAGRVLAYDHDGDGLAAPDFGDATVAAQGLGEQGLKLGRPGFLMGSPAQQLLQRRESLVVFAENINYLAASHLSACGCHARGYRDGRSGRPGVAGETPLVKTE